MNEKKCDVCGTLLDLNKDKTYLVKTVNFFYKTRNVFRCNRLRTMWMPEHFERKTNEGRRWTKRNN